MEGYRYGCHICGRTYYYTKPTKHVKTTYDRTIPLANGSFVYDPTSWRKTYTIGFTCPLGHYRMAAQTHSLDGVEEFKVASWADGLKKGKAKSWADVVKGK